MFKVKRSLTMKALFRVLKLVLLITVLTGSTASVSAQEFIPQLLSGLILQWAQVPGAPGVQYAPNANADVFRYGNRYYYQHHDGTWYQGRDIAGPWQRIQDVPRSFHQIEAPYFKQPPGWAKGKKTGWGGGSMPPGQMKKYDQGQHIPPGQMKKYEGGQHMPPGQMKKHGN
jgi:hypothetical protein